MKKNIGKYNAAFPTPIVVVGAMVDGKPAWFEVAWVGIGDQDIVTLSVTPTHYTCKGINEQKVLSIALTNDKTLQRADYVGIVSGNKVDKSEVFAWTKGELGAPIIDDADVVMECELLEFLKTDHVSGIVGRIVNVKAEEAVLSENARPTPRSFTL